MDRLLKSVRDFLTLKLIPGNRLLLALSGGCDSLALLYILIECQKLFDFELHLAHVDHAWRAASSNEARILKQLSEHLKVPFHHRRLEPLSGSNLEDRYREKRYAFFHELQEMWGFQAVLLAHHADDQGETLLKRICEGARLGALGGLQPETQRGILTLWRPLLAIRKEELSRFLKMKRITPFDDSTNRDIHYLRPRMRLQIFPGLEKQFGKKMGRNFHRLGLLFQDVKSYLEEKKKEIEKSLVRGPFGNYLENPSQIPKLEMRYFLEEVARTAKAHLSHDSCDVLLRLIEMRAPKATFHAAPLSYVLNQNVLFLLDRDMPSFDWKNWTQKTGKSTWKEFWKGVCSKTPSGSELLIWDRLTPVWRQKMKKWYTKNRVPLFFHDKAPVFCVQGKIIGECLTGKELNL